MSQTFLDLPARQGISKIWKGIIAQPPLNFRATCSVIIPDMNPNLAFENVRWQARDTMSLPEDGDSCVVAFDNNQEPWIVTWWPADKRPSWVFSKTAPINPVDGDIWMAEDVDSASRWTMFVYHDGAWEPVAPSNPTFLAGSFQTAGIGFNAWSAFGSAQHQVSFAVFSGSFGPGKKFTQYRWIGTVSVGGTNGNTAWNLTLGLAHSYVSWGHWLYSPSVTPQTTVQQFDSGWFNLGDYSNITSTMQLGYNWGITGGTDNPSNPILSANLWVR